jgi:hypothetical protein
MCACWHANRASTAWPTSTRAWYKRHTRRAVVRLGAARRSGATQRQGLWCLRWCARSLARVRAGVCTRPARKAESHPGGRAHTGWTGRAEGFDPSGVCVCICADVSGVATAVTRNACTVTTQRQEHNEQIWATRCSGSRWPKGFELGVDGSTDTRAPVRWGSRRRHDGVSDTVTDR